MPDRDTSGFTPLPDDIVQAAEQRRRSKRSTRRALNALSVLFLLAAVVLCGVYVMIWNDPYSPLNPLPPNTPFPVMVSETPQATATLTPTVTRTPVPTLPATDTPIPTTPTPDTPVPTLTFTPLPASALGIVLGTPQETSGTGGTDTTIVPGFPYIMRGGRAVYLTNPEGRGGCAWSSITGTVIDSAGAEVVGYGVHIVGGGIDQFVATGSEPSAGLGGYELQLASEATDATFTIQLVDPSGAPMSDVYTVLTRADCQYNIAAVHFVPATAP
ncbi:MAG: hypothetical protein U0670_24535 [Anaerolineae bacterium]